MIRRRLATVALSAVVSTLGGCDPTLEHVDAACHSASDCMLGDACDPRSNRCVREPEGSLFGRFTCRVFDDVVTSGSLGTSDVVGSFEGQRIQLQGGSACFAGSIKLQSSPDADGTVHYVAVTLPAGFAGGTFNLGTTNTFFFASGGGRTHTDVEHGAVSGLMQIDHYGAGATITGAIVLTASRGCGKATGAFCPTGQRCAAVFRAREDEGICVAAPPSGTCTSNTDCQLGENCVGGVCGALCTSEGCFSGQLCAAVNDPTFIELRTGICKPAEQVAKPHDPCPPGTACQLDSICVGLAAGPVCADFCQTNLSCGGNGFGCVSLTTGQMVCVAGTVKAGESCANGELCTYESVCLGGDNTCHEYCTGNADCPGVRPVCKSLKSGRAACDVP